MRNGPLYFWLYTDPKTGLLVQTDFLATAEEIRLIAPQAEPIPWTKREQALFGRPATRPAFRPDPSRRS